MTAIPRFGVSAKFRAKADSEENALKNSSRLLSATDDSTCNGSRERTLDFSRSESLRTTMQRPSAPSTTFSEDQSSLFSLYSYASCASDSTVCEQKRPTYRKKLTNAFHRLRKGAYSKSRSTSITHVVDEPAETQFSCTLPTESLVSSVLRDKKGFIALMSPMALDDSNRSKSGSKPSLPAQPLSVVIQKYVTALELTELEDRRERPDSAVDRPLPLAPSSCKSTRGVSFRDPHRRMRPVSSTVTVSSDAQALSQLVESTSEEQESRLGFGNLPDQVHRKAVKKGFNFTLMVVGESGLGKSTLINSLFMQDLYKDREIPDASERIRSTTRIEKRQIELDERGVKLRLTVVDTPGFNDAVNCTACWKPIENFIDDTFEQYFKDECGLNRKNIHDNRVHCCLYFISPYGHGLRPVDVEFMRRLQHKVNIVPIIAKADALTASELRTFKERIMADFDRYKIDIYRLPECDSDEEDEIKQLDKEIKSVLPFAVIGSNCVVEQEGGRRTRGRQYPWGVVEVENAKHCDFTKLRIFLLKTHMQDLKDMTLDVHYENYRAKYITERMSKRQTDRRELGGVRTERENTANFEGLVDQDNLIRQKEDELQRMQQMVQRMQEQLKRGTVTAAQPPTPGPNVAPIVNANVNNL